MRRPRHALGLIIGCLLPTAAQSDYYRGQQGASFVFLDDGEKINYFNNGKWYNSTRINNNSELANQAKSVSTGSDVMFIYVPGKGMCDIFNKHSEIDRETIERIASRCTEFLGAPLRVGDLDEVDFQVRDRGIPDPSHFENQEQYKEEVYRIAGEQPHSAYAHAKYAYRDWTETAPQVYAHAALREYETQQLAKSVNTLQDAIAIVKSIGDSESIFTSRDRLALPDETLLFDTGDDRDRALLLYTLIEQSDIRTENLKIGFGDASSYIVCDDLWVDISDCSISKENPKELTHVFNHKSSWDPAGIFEEESEAITEQVMEAFDREEESRKKQMSAGVVEGAFPKFCETDLPDGVREFLNIRSVGPWTAHRLWVELKVADMNSLKKAAQEKRIRHLDGFGEKSEQRILDEILNR